MFKTKITASKKEINNRVEEYLNCGYKLDLAYPNGSIILKKNEFTITIEITE